MTEFERPRINLEKSPYKGYWIITEKTNFLPWLPWHQIWINVLKSLRLDHLEKKGGLMQLSTKQVQELIKFLPDSFEWTSSDHRICEYLFKSERDRIERLIKACAVAQETDNGISLRPYQTDGMRWRINRPSSLLADEVGLGKTVQTLLSIMVENVLTKSLKPVLVLGSPIAMVTWLGECEKFLRKYDVLLVKNTNSFRLPRPGEVILCTWGMLRNQKVFRRSGNRRESSILMVQKPYAGTALVGDEIQAVRNPDTLLRKYWNAVKAGIYEVGGSVHGLSATPFGNNPGEFWSVLEALDLHEKAFGNKKNFVKYYGGRKGPFGLEWDNDAVVDPIVPKLLKTVMLQRKISEVRKDLPDIITRLILVTPSKTNPVWKEMAAIQKRLDDLEIDVPEMLERVLRGDWDFTEYAEVRRLCSWAKVPFLIEYLTELKEFGGERPPIVMSYHRDAISVVVEQNSNWGKIDGSMSITQRKKVATEFNDGELDGIICSIRATNESVTLVGGNRMVFVDLDWNPMINTQCAGRYQRYGQTSDVLYRDIFAIKGSIDEKVIRVLAKKQRWIDSTFI